MPKKSGAAKPAVDLDRVRPPEDPIMRKEHARLLAKNPYFRAFINSTRDRLRVRWENTQETLVRESLWFKMQGLNELMKELLMANDAGLRKEYEERVMEARRDVESRGLVAEK